MKKNKINIIILSALLLLPVISSAEALGGLKGLITAIGGIVNMIIPIMFGIAVIYFFWGLGQFILHSDDEKVRDQGKQQILWGVIAMFVIISIYGIITFIGGALGIDIKGPVPATTVSGGNNNLEGGMCPGGGFPPC